MCSYSGGAINFNSLYSNLRMICANTFCISFFFERKSYGFVSVAICSNINKPPRRGLKKWTTQIVH